MIPFVSRGPRLVFMRLAAGGVVAACASCGRSLDTPARTAWGAERAYVRAARREWHAGPPPTERFVACTVCEAPVDVAAAELGAVLSDAQAADAVVVLHEASSLLLQTALADELMFRDPSRQARMRRVIDALERLTTRLTAPHSSRPGLLPLDPSAPTGASSRPTDLGDDK